MPKIEKILYATDLSHSAPHAFAYAVMMAEQFSAHLTVLHVVEPLATMERTTIHRYLGKDAPSKIGEAQENFAITEMKKRVEEFFVLEKTEKQFVEPVCFEVVQGNAEEEILKHDDYDLVIMGSHEKSFTHNYSGHITKRVLKKSETPVFIVPLSLQMEKE